MASVLEKLGFDPEEPLDASKETCCGAALIGSTLFQNGGIIETDYRSVLAIANDFRKRCGEEPDISLADLMNVVENN
jgi:hypothetical protein